MILRELPSCRCARDKSQHGTTAMPVFAGICMACMTSAGGLLLFMKLYQR